MLFDLETLYFLNPNKYSKKMVEEEIYFRVFNDLLFLLKDMKLSAEDLDKIIKYFEEKLNNVKPSPEDKKKFSHST